MKNLKFITRTALLLALTVMFQMLRPLISLPPLGSNFIIGSLVNASLAVSSVVVGIWGGIIISIAAPIIAFLQQHINFIWLVPVVAGGNAVLVLLFGWLYKNHKVMAVVSSSVVKALVLYGLVMMSVRIFVVPGPAVAMLSLMFSWPQLVTAVIGGLLAITVLRALSKKYDFLG